MLGVASVAPSLCFSNGPCETRTLSTEALSQSLRSDGYIHTLYNLIDDGLGLVAVLSKGPARPS